MAIDRFNRNIDYLRISITDRCNLHCEYCMPEARPSLLPPDRLLRAEEIVRLVRIGCELQVRKVRLTGGEPLVREDILAIVAGVKAAGVPELSLTTNGLLLGEQAGALKKAGLDRVNVSLDSLDPEKYRQITGGGRLSRVLAGIREARRVGLAPVKINVVMLRGVNDDEILSFARLTYEEHEHPFHVRFIEVMPTAARHDRWGSRQGLTAAEAMSMVAALGPLERLEFRGRGPSRNYRLPGAPGVLGFISPLSHSFCYCCNRLRISAAGRIRPCLFAADEVDIHTPLRQGADDGELRLLFARAVAMKPEGNFLAGAGPRFFPSMSSIGG